MKGEEVDASTRVDGRSIQILDALSTERSWGCWRPPEPTGYTIGVASSGLEPCMSLASRIEPSCSLALIALVAVVGGCASPSPLDAPARHYPGVSVSHREVTTSSPEAQAWFDQGLTLLYGFNHDEATRSFHAATKVDPSCSMAWWGVAIASGIDLNNQSMSDEDCRRAYFAAERAVATADGATDVEAALARAIATRFAWPPPEDRAELDEAYADAMRVVWETYPNDQDVATLYADSLMALQPWDYWTPEGEAKGRIQEAVTALEGALEQHPEHVGACHFLIHAVEAGDPERAAAAADRLALRVPGAGHLLHMPSHIYVHIGRFADASDANERAIAADLAYFEVAPEPTFYTLYYAHNVHMLAFAAMMEGREEVAMKAARQLERDVPEHFIKSEPQFVDGLMATPLHVMVRFGHWEDILNEPEPPAYRLLSIAQRHYARGVAFAALGRTQEARAEQKSFEAAAAAVPESWLVGANPSEEILGLARQMLEGEILWREGRVNEAFAAMAEGARLEDQLVYDEPPGWMQPVRHAYGALLMADKRFDQAEQIYREDLARNPGNGWSLLGLGQALSAQGRQADAGVVAKDLARVWARADVSTGSSCFCEPGENKWVPPRPVSLAP